MQATLEDIHRMVGGLWIEARLMTQQAAELEMQLSVAKQEIKALKAQLAEKKSE